MALPSTLGVVGTTCSSKGGFCSPISRADNRVPPHPPSPGAACAGASTCRHASTTSSASILRSGCRFLARSHLEAADWGGAHVEAQLKGTVSRDFLLPVFFMNQFPPSPRVSHLDRFELFRKFAEIFASQGAPQVSTTPVANLPPVSTTPAANFATIFPSVVDTGGNRYQLHGRQILPPFSLVLLIPVANLPPVSTIPAANLLPGSITPVAICHTVSTSPAANLPPVSMTLVANNGNNIRLQRP